MNFLHSRTRVLLFIILHFGCASILASQHLARKLLWIVQNCHYLETNQFLNLIFWLLNIISGVWIKMSPLLATRLYDTGGVIVTEFFYPKLKLKAEKMFWNLAQAQLIYLKNTGTHLLKGRQLMMPTIPTLQENTLMKYTLR